MNSGLLLEFWRKLDRPSPRIVQTIQAPMSIHPHRPNESWSASLEEVYLKIQDHISNQKPDIFIASAGGYAPLLAHRVWKDYQIPSHCYGHALNKFFSIYTNSIETDINLLSRIPIDSPLWIKSHLRQIQYPELNRLDGGKYLI